MRSAYKVKIDLDALTGREMGIDLLGHVSSLATRRVARARQSELLLSEYERRGESCFYDMEGSFAAVVRERDCVKVVTDRMATRKVYYYLPPGRGEVWLSESLAALVSMGTPKVLDRRALFEYCTTWYLQGNRTILEGVRVVRPAHVLRIGPQGVTEAPYWIPAVDGYVQQGRTLDSLVEEFHAIWSGEMERISRLDERFLIPLSGGLDGRLILSSLLQHVSPKSVLTYTFGVPGTYDYEIGQKAAKAFGCENIAVPAIEKDLRRQIGFAIDECEGQIKCIPGSPFPFSGFVGMGVTTVLSGFVGDALAGGSWTKRPYYGQTSEDPAEVSRILEKIHAKTDPRRVAALFGLGREEVEPLKVFPPPMHSPYITDNIERHLYENRVANYLSYVLLPEHDAFDYHLPFASRRLFDFGVKVPAEHKIHGRFYYDYLRRHHPKLASIPTKTYWGIALRSSPLRVAFGMVRRKGRNFLNRRALRLLNRPLFGDPYVNYIDEFDLYRRDADFRALTADCLRSLREQPFVEKSEVDGVIRDSARMTPRLMMLVSYLVQVECVAQWYDNLATPVPASRGSGEGVSERG